MHGCISEPSGSPKSQKKLCDKHCWAGSAFKLALPTKEVLGSAAWQTPAYHAPRSKHPPNTHHVPSTPPHHQSGLLTPLTQIPWLPVSSPLHCPPSQRRGGPLPSTQHVSPGMTKSLGPMETSGTRRPRKKSAFKGLKIRQSLWKIMTIPSLTACKTNCKARLPDLGFPP